MARPARPWRTLTVAVALVLAVSACSSSGSNRAAPRTTTSTLASTTTTTLPLVPWTGPVEHLFFHTLVIHPELAFGDPSQGRGFLDYFVTVGEFRAILQQLDTNGWTLVDLHRAVAGTVRVPAGRRPFVLSEDDVNYYDYERTRELGWRLALDGKGQVKVEERNARGVRLTDDDIVPIVDEFVARHPDFSAEGAKGVLAPTGYEGLLGERVQDLAAPDHDAAVARARAVADRLKATGWTFASHGYGHLDLSTLSPDRAQRDAERWKALADPILGPTDVYIYPFGARPTVAARARLTALGFTIFCDIDPAPRMLHQGNVMVMSRRHIDGLALRQQHDRLLPLFDTTLVEDKMARREPS